jgi:positive regulator of sigma E activity
MFSLITNPKTRIALSLIAGFGIGLLISGGLADLLGISQLLVMVAALPLLAVGFYLNLTAYAARLEQR